MSASVWVAEVPRPADVPIEHVHVMLFSYFPGTAPGSARPYVWRLLAGNRIGIVSALRPTASTARQVVLEAGITWPFRLTYKRQRNVGGDRVRQDGSRQQRQSKVVTITSMPELRTRLIAFAGQRGGAVGFVRLDRMRELRLPGERRIVVPIVDAEGQVLVTDPVRFAALLAGGGPGTAKAYGCGCWWLPGLMEPAG